jgi:hypothetical protein
MGTSVFGMDLRIALIIGGVLLAILIAAIVVLVAATRRPRD